MLDLIALAKKLKIESKIVAEIEAMLEYSLGEIAEDHFTKSKVKNWHTSYCFAASVLSPNDNPKIIEQFKSEYPPILDIHADAVLSNLTAKHFSKLMVDKDPGAVVQAFVNIERWNTNLSKWARKILSELINDYNKSDSCISEIVVPPLPEDLGIEGENFAIDMSKLTPSKLDPNTKIICKCPNCGLEIESLGRACETIECPRCPGVYLKMKD